MPTIRHDIASPIAIPEIISHFLLFVLKYFARGNKLEVNTAKNMISLGLKKLCAKILGCKEYINVENIALFVVTNISFENKKKAIIPKK